MLPDEVLRDIVFPAIWRNPKARQLLETLEITSRRFNAVAVSLIEEGIVGVRVVTRMRVYNTGEVILLAGTLTSPLSTQRLSHRRRFLQNNHLRLPCRCFAATGRAKSGIRGHIQPTSP